MVIARCTSNTSGRLRSQSDRGRRLDRSEADAAAFGLCYLDVGELVGGDDDSPALLVGEGQRRGTVLECAVDRGLDLVHALVAVEDEFARGALDADPDLHAVDPTCRGQWPSDTR